MQMNDSASDAATQIMIENQLPGLPAGYNPATGVPTYVTPPPTGTTPDNVQPSALSTFFANLPNIVTGGVTAYQAIQLQNMQADLIKRGLPPLTPYQLAQMRPGIGVGLTPDTQQMLIYLALGGGALLLLTSLMKGRRAKA